MLDEREIYKLIAKIPKEKVKMFPGWPETFSGLSDKMAVGSWKLDDNSVADVTSSNKEYETRVRIQINTWSRTPEQRNDLNMIVDSIFGQIFRRQSVASLEENLPGNIRTYRSIMIYSGTVNASTLNVSRI